MASRATLPEAPQREPYRSPFGQELAPSELRADEPSFARLVGMAGLGAVVVGAAVLVFNARGPRIIGPIWGYLFVPFGLAGLLFHAARDPDLQVRRTYGVLGGFLPILIAVAVSLLPLGGGVGALFLPIGVPAFLLGLLFLLPFARHEDEAFWRRLIVAALVGVGAALAAVGFVGSNVSTDFLLTRGLILTLFGLFYLWAGVGALGGSSSDLGYRLGLAIGALGLLVFLVALVRSAIPPLVQAFGRAGGPAPYFLPGGLLLMAVGLLYLAFAIGICSDARYVVMVRRELSAYFYSPIAYLVLFGMTVIGWWTYATFSSVLIEMMERSRPIPEPIVFNFIVDFYPVMSLLFVVPALTMRLLSEEKRTGTLEVMLTAPVDEKTVVLSKFTAALVFFLFLWIPWGLFLIALRVEGGQPFDYRPLLSFGVILVCTSAALLSMGLFFSSLTRNQIVAAVLSFMGMMLMLGLYFVQQQVGPTWQTVFAQLSFVDQWIQSLRGKLYLRSVIAQLSITVFWLFLTVKALEARKWS